VLTAAPEDGIQQHGSWKAHMQQPDLVWGRKIDFFATALEDSMQQCESWNEHTKQLSLEMVVRAKRSCCVTRIPLSPKAAAILCS